jgi:sucrose-6-phosphate hydrolase SacC (GH32 family)
VSDFRPRLHFASQKNWINDPNGLVFDAETGLYHLFFQYNPFGDQWGHMSWGHAVSSDLRHWEELPVAIPEDERVSIFSGSVVIDRDNTSGFGHDGLVPWVAIYTGCRRVPEGGQAQELAYSLDRGHTWTKFIGNPVLDLGLKDFRDPKVLRYRGRWIMAVVFPNEHQIGFFESRNLRDWTPMSRFGPAGGVGSIWECPDLIHFPDADRWLLKVDTFADHPAGSGAQCWVGRFDGHRFEAEGEAFWVDGGSDFYAGLSFGELPAGRSPLWLAWMNNHAYAKATPTSPWRGAMSWPRELQLVPTEDEGWRLRQTPWPLDAWRGSARHLVGAGVLPAVGECFELHWDLDPGAARLSTLNLRCGPGGGEFTEIGIDHERGRIWIDRSRSGQRPDERAWSGRRETACARGRLGLRVIVDRCSVEVFAGEAALTELIFPGPQSLDLALLARGGDWQRSVLTVWPIE